MSDKTKVEIIESEAGWAPKVEEVLEFDSYDEAMKFVKDYNTQHNPPATFTPSWYMFARIVGDNYWGMRRHD